MRISLLSHRRQLSERNVEKTKNVAKSSEATRRGERSRDIFNGTLTFLCRGSQICYAGQTLEALAR